MEDIFLPATILQYIASITLPYYRTAQIPLEKESIEKKTRLWRAKWIWCCSFCQWAEYREITTFIGFQCSVVYLTYSGKRYWTHCTKRSQLLQSFQKAQGKPYFNSIVFGEKCHIRPKLVSALHLRSSTLWVHVVNIMSHPVISLPRNSACIWAAD